MEDRDRDMLIRVETSLANVNQNQLQILEDLRTIFNRLEQESKIVTIISGDLKAHLESSVVRWNNIDKQMTEFERRISANETRLEQVSTNLSMEKEDRTKAVTVEHDARVQDNQEREGFEREVKASIRILGWLLGALASIATIISVFAMFHKG